MIRAFWLAAILLLTSLPVVSNASSAEAINNVASLTRAGQILSLTPEEADAGQTVRLRGLITLYRPEWNLFFVQDDSGGVYLFNDQKRWDMHNDQWVEVKAVTGKGRRSNMLLNPEIRALSADESRPPIVHPRPVSLEFLLSGKLDAQWIRLTNTVREASLQGDDLILRFGPQHAGITALIPRPSSLTNPASLIRAHVVLNGVCTEQGDEQGRLLSTTVFCPSTDSFQVLAWPAKEPFDTPLQSISNCLDSVWLADKDLWVRLQGTAIGTLSNNSFYLDDGNRAIAVTPSADPKVKAGDRLEVVGFLVQSAGTAHLENALTRKEGTSVPPQPLAITTVQASSREIEGRLVSLEARLLEYARQKEMEVVTVSALGMTLSAELATTNQVGTLAVFKPDSLLRLTGIWLGRQGEASRPGLRLLLRDTTDARLLQPPPWWTPRRVGLVVGGLVSAVLLVSVWAMSLRVQVHRKAQQIRQRLEKEAELQKRFHDLVENANDMVCTLDTEGRVTSMNRAGECILGFSKEALNSRGLKEVLVPESLHSLKQMLAARDGAGEFRGELKVVAADRSERILEVDSRPFGDSGIQVIARDVTARKTAEAELAALQSQLLDSSRKAGMAEIAIAILHNVGNVLNSLNVSANLISERFRRSKITHVTRLAQLMQDHAADIGDFMVHHPKGRQVPAFLNQLSEHLVDEQSAILNELAALSNNVDHIKTIVSAQQGYAKVGGVFETINPAQVVDDALRVILATLERRHIKLVREYDAQRLPQMSLDKHRVLQILINLVRNAALACEESGCPDRCLTLRIVNGEGLLKISVLDNGVGIAPENLTRIFNHGFTTRKDGHGFGLHSGALAAKEMGGELRVQSEGLGKGAAFTLELPMNKNAA